MTTISKMIRHTFKKADKIEVFGISDAHVGHEGFNEAEFQRLSRFIMSEEHNYVVLAGDLCDNQVKSSVGSPFESTMRPSDQRKYVTELLLPIRDRILCIHPGNHEEKSVKDTDTNPIELIAERLDILDRYGRDQVYLDIIVGERPNHRQRPPRYCVNVRHGKGGGKLAGSGLNTADYVAATSGADLFIMGHTHKPSIGAGSRMVFDQSNGQMIQRDYQVLICTSWLDYVGYGVRNLYRPTPITVNRATLYGNTFGIETHQRTN